MTTAQQTAARTYVANELPRQLRPLEHQPQVPGPGRRAPAASCITPPGSGTGPTSGHRRRWQRQGRPEPPRDAQPLRPVAVGLPHRRLDASCTTTGSIKSYYSAISGQGNIYGTMCAHIAMARMAQHQNDTTHDEHGRQPTPTPPSTTARPSAPSRPAARARYYRFYYNNNRQQRHDLPRLDVPEPLARGGPVSEGLRLHRRAGPHRPGQEPCSPSGGCCRRRTSAELDRRRGHRPAHARWPA